MKFLKAALVILLIPAILTLIGTFDTYVDEKLSLTALQEVVWRLFPFAFIALCILGLFFALRRKGGGDDN